MQPYSSKKSFSATCKCWDCRRGRKKLHGGTDPIRRALKKGARQAARQRIAGVAQ